MSNSPLESSISDNESSVLLFLTCQKIKVLTSSAGIFHGIKNLIKNFLTMKQQ